MKIKIEFDLKTVEKYMKDNKLNRPQFAYHLGVSCKIVDQILQGKVYIDSEMVSQIYVFKWFEQFKWFGLLFKNFFTKMYKYKKKLIFIN